MNVHSHMRGRHRALVYAITVLLLHACTDTHGRSAQGQRGSDQQSGVDSATLVDQFDLSPNRARLLSSAVDGYMRAIGGPDAYASVLKGIGAEPSPASIQQYTGLLLLRGTARLGSVAIDSLSALRSRWFSLYYPSQCDLLVGPKDLKAGWTALASLDSVDLVALFRLTARATVAEAKGSPSEPQFDRSRLAAAWRAFYANLPSSEQDRFAEFVNAPRHSTEDECWFQYQFWHVLPLVSETDARILLWQIATNKFS